MRSASLVLSRRKNCQSSSEYVDYCSAMLSRICVVTNPGQNSSILTACMGEYASMMHGEDVIVTDEQVPNYYPAFSDRPLRHCLKSS